MDKREEVKIYFGSNGVTSTSANYVANIAKELIRKEQADLDNVDFVSTTICAAQQDTVHTTKIGDDETALFQLPQKLERIAKMKSLIGWLREGIKAKENMIRDVENMEDSKVLEKLGLKKVEIKGILDEYTEATFLKTLSEEEQRKIQLLSTKAAIYGKFIHEKGPFGKARQKVFECLHEPSHIEKTIGVITIAESTPSVDAEKIDAVYFDLQKQYREIQKELNSHIFKMKDEMHRVNIEIGAHNVEARKELRAAQKELDEAIKTYKKKECKRIGDLKIVIPQELRDIFDEVNNA